jgi:hypothetical protein
MLRRLGRQVVRSSTFPPPDGFSSWADGDAVDELICAMFVEEPRLVVGCAVKAHDDASMERLLLAAIKNWLIDQANGCSKRSSSGPGTRSCAQLRSPPRRMRSSPPQA